MDNFQKLKNKFVGVFQEEILNSPNGSLFVEDIIKVAKRLKDGSFKNQIAGNEQFLLKASPSQEQKRSPSSTEESNEEGKININEPTESETAEKIETENNAPEQESPETSEDSTPENEETEAVEAEVVQPDQNVKSKFNTSKAEDVEYEAASKKINKKLESLQERINKLL